ncbi:MAG TPA: NAD(P)/FAD-dependent oxidoreductase [Blastocatellia bacterium]|nr:NAD(P)/FAD-dependent oxidoreductase [Blastocatellia bacterium]
MTPSPAENSPWSCDVAIVGGGPAGSATALSLRSHAPSLSVVLIEASRYQTPRVGETLPPPARSILEHLGVWEAFRAQRHREVHGTTAVWGAAAPLDNDFIYMPANTGWHLDRVAFDAMLAEQAKSRSVSLLLDTRLGEAKRAGERWRLTLSNGRILFARFIVDATGGSAAFARRCGARFIDSDRLIGISRFFEGGSADPRTLVEPFEEGWWYTAGLPAGRRIAACMTDADLARRMGLKEEEQWARTLAAMSSVRAMLRGSKPCSPVVVRSTESRRLEPAAGDTWLAVGDSASRFDPLSSQGIVKALRSGIFASYAIGDLLARNDDSGLRRYRRYVAEEFKSYTAVRAKYYRQEQRWPGSEFWRRRQVETAS